MRILFFIIFVSASFVAEAQGNYLLFRSGERLDFARIRFRNPLFDIPYIEIDRERKIEYVTIDKIVRNGIPSAVRYRNRGTRTPLILNIDTEGDISLFYTVRVTPGGYDPRMGIYEPTQRKLDYYIEKQKYQLQDFTIRNMEIATADYLPSLEYVMKARKMDRLKWTFYGAAIISVVYYFTSDNLQSTGISFRNPMIYVALGSTLGASIAASQVGKNLRDAVFFYNSRKK